MDSRLQDLEMMADLLTTAPTFEDMPKRTMADKGIAGPTAAHVIEEVHTPLNLAYLTFTTGSTAFQNIVGVTYDELPDRIAASQKALALAGVKAGDHVVVTYPPLVNVFFHQSLRDYGLTWEFLRRSSREDLILALCTKNPQVLVGESSFIRATLVDAERMGLADLLPRDLILICSGTPFDLELPEVADKYGYKCHDLYGCQEFGWLTLDGVPVRDDLTLVPMDEEGRYCELVVGGLPMGDSFQVSKTGHVLNPEGQIITYSRRRTHPEFEVFVRETAAASKVTMERAARTMLRIKSRVVKLTDDIVEGADHTVLELKPANGKGKTVVIDTPEKTRLFDKLVAAQQSLQSGSKKDPTWIKGR